MSYRAARLLTCAGALSLVAACSESPVPVQDPAEARIDTRLIGTWTSEEADQLRVRIVPFDEHQLLAELIDADFVDGGYVVERTLYRVLASDVDGATWISATILAESEAEFREMQDDPVWHIARLEFVEEGNVLFTELSDSIDFEGIDAPDRLRALLRQRKDDPGLISGDTVRFASHETASLEYDPEPH